MATKRLRRPSLLPEFENLSLIRSAVYGKMYLAANQRPVLPSLSTIGPENTNFVGNVDYIVLAPCQIPLSGIFRSRKCEKLTTDRRRTTRDYNSSKFNVLICASIKKNTRKSRCSIIFSQSYICINFFTKKKKKKRKCCLSAFVATCKRNTDRP